MFGCRNSYRIRISLSDEHGTPSRSVNAFSLAFLMATKKGFPESLLALCSLALAALFSFASNTLFSLNNNARFPKTSLASFFLSSFYISMF